VEFHGGTARVSKNCVHSFALECGDKYVSPFHGRPTLAFNFGIGLDNGFSVHGMVGLKVINMSKTAFLFKVERKGSF
jgi:hypothetical protein